MSDNLLGVHRAFILGVAMLSVAGCRCRPSVNESDGGVCKTAGQTFCLGMFDLATCVSDGGSLSVDVQDCRYNDWECFEKNGTAKCNKGTCTFSWCGNGECLTACGESAASCPQDCDADAALPDGGAASDAGTCSDGVCETLTEDCISCPVDCGACPTCGNGACEVGETCPVDCGMCGCCGDTVCQAYENCGTCPADCGTCVAGCGDGVCDINETCTDCPADCGVCEGCGDAVCAAPEDCTTCALDCGPCTPECGNGFCEVGESCVTCSQDCPACVSPVCGDGICDPGEDYCSCPYDACAIC